MARNQETARWIPLLVVGMSLNTLGIVMTSLGWARYVLMGGGLLLILVALLKSIAASKRAGGPPAEG